MSECVCSHLYVDHEGWLEECMKWRCSCRGFQKKMNYRELLIKYIKHVYECEGVDFLLFGDDLGAKALTPTERSELDKLAHEAEKRRKSEADEKETH